jgi:hypothetical protein
VRTVAEDWLASLSPSEQKSWEAALAVAELMAALPDPRIPPTEPLQAAFEAAQMLASTVTSMQITFPAWERPGTNLLERLQSLRDKFRETMRPVERELIEAATGVRGKAVQLGMFTAPTAHHLGLEMANKVLLRVRLAADPAAWEDRLPDPGTPLPLEAIVRHIQVVARLFPMPGLPDARSVVAEMQLERAEAERRRGHRGTPDVSGPAPELLRPVPAKAPSVSEITATQLADKPERLNDQQDPVDVRRSTETTTGGAATPSPAAGVQAPAPSGAALAGGVQMSAPQTLSVGLEALWSGCEPEVDLFARQLPRKFEKAFVAGVALLGHLDRFYDILEEERIGVLEDCDALATAESTPESRAEFEAIRAQVVASWGPPVAMTADDAADAFAAEYSTLRARFPHYEAAIGAATVELTAARRRLGPVPWEGPDAGGTLPACHAHESLLRTARIILGRFMPRGTLPDCRALTAEELIRSYPLVRAMLRYGRDEWDADLYRWVPWMREETAEAVRVLAPASPVDAADCPPARDPDEATEGAGRQAAATINPMSDGMDVVEAQGTGQTAIVAAPTTWLFNWRDILDALRLRNNDQSRNKVRRINEGYAGPIMLPGKGGQPKVDKAKLLVWWDGLETQFKEHQQRRADVRATVAEQYLHGKTAVVVPDIGGRVKKRKK